MMNQKVVNEFESYKEIVIGMMRLCSLVVVNREVDGTIYGYKFCESFLKCVRDDGCVAQLNFRDC